MGHDDCYNQKKLIEFIDSAITIVSEKACSPLALFVCAPTGFGKSTIKTFLGKIYEERGWEIFRYEPDGDCTLSVFIQELEEKILQTIDPDQSAARKGLLIFDQIEKLNESEVGDIPKVLRMIKNAEFNCTLMLFSNQLADYYQDKFPDLYINEYTDFKSYKELHCFSLHNILDILESALRDGEIPPFENNNRRLRRDALGIYYLSGGHPELASKIIDEHIKTNMRTLDFSDLIAIKNHFIDHITRLINIAKADEFLGEYWLEIRDLGPGSASARLEHKRLDNEISEFIIGDDDRRINGFGKLSKMVDGPMCISWESIISISLVDLRFNDTKRYIALNKRMIEYFWQNFETDGNLSFNQKRELVVNILYHSLQVIHFSDYDSNSELRSKTNKRQYLVEIINGKVKEIHPNWKVFFADKTLDEGSQDSLIAEINIMCQIQFGILLREMY